MGSSYAAFLMFLCVAMVALTAPSAANLVNTVNLNGALVCNGTGTPAAPNVTASLLCLSDLVQIRFVLNANITTTGTISVSVNIVPLIAPAITPARCVMLLPSQACPGSANVTLGTTVAVSRSGITINVSPTGQVGLLNNILSST